MVGKQDLREVTTSQLEALVDELGQPAFRAKQIRDWLWNKNISSISKMSNLPKSLRETLASRFVIAKPRIASRLVSNDGTRKYLLAYADGARAECVGMPSGNRLTVCISTQAGCAMGCSFCATGRLGLSRSLEAHEMYDQVSLVGEDFATRVTSVVLMGQGEPFMNYNATLRAMRLLNSSTSMGIGARHITVSTCGIIPGILRFAKEPEQFTLAVSLHSAVQSTRNLLMPGVKKYSLLNLYEAMGSYVDITGRRPTYEYALIAGINDTEDELGALCDFCRGTLSHVNLIRLNEVSKSPFQPSSDARANDFVRRLASVGVEATIRESRGSDIAAACGQLSLQTKSQRD